MKSTFTSLAMFQKKTLIKCYSWLTDAQLHNCSCDFFLFFRWLVKKMCDQNSISNSKHKTKMFDDIFKMSATWSSKIVWKKKLSRGECLGYQSIKAKLCFFFFILYCTSLAKWSANSRWITNLKRKLITLSKHTFSIQNAHLEFDKTKERNKMEHSQYHNLNSK